MPRFVLEIGTEEIPPRYFPVALPHLAEEGKALLQRARLWLPESDIKVYGTPRRLVFIGEDIAALQAPAVREERGPAVKVAFGADGKPTKAAEGFARRWGLTPDKLERRSTEQGEYVFAIIQEPELPAAQALAPLLPSLITGIPFPKTMRWGSGTLRFGRPIRWLLALVDDQVIEFELEGLKSGRLTRGHPVLAEGMYEVEPAAGYERELEGHKVIANPEERHDLIRQLLDVEAEKSGGKLVDGGLLTETTYLVEWPTAATGSFDPAFLRLPRPVLVEEMRHVQCYFPLEDDHGKLLPKFVAVRDGGDAHLDTVLAGWESVLRSKLIDASYFYEQDLKTPLADRVEALKGVVFQEKLGTMYDKMERVRAIAGDVAQQLHLPADQRRLLDRAALLCKADLTTEMVTDVSALQGLMGREYALAAGEAGAVADAIGEHYRPRFAGDEIPASRLGQLLAIADKVDSITTYLAVGMTPTGSADPFGLRREGAGVVSTLVEAELTLSVGRLVGLAYDGLADDVQPKMPRDQVVAEVLDFLRQRLEAHLREQGIRYDLVDSALAVGVDDLSRAYKRAHFLQFVAGPTREEPVPEYQFLPTVIATTRVINIIKGFEGGEIDEKLLAEKGEPAEKALWQAYRDALAKADQCSLRKLFGLLAAMRPTIDRFFDEVLVMHEDPEIRRNRLALCWNINENLFRRLADFSLIVQT